MATSAAAQEKKNIIIVGGGIIGCTTAYYLTRHPSYNPALHTIHLIEATGIASGASGKAGGLLALWAYPSSIAPLSFRLHQELAQEHGGPKRWGYRALHCGQLNIKARQISNAAAEGRGKPTELDGPHQVEREHLPKRSQESENAENAVKCAGVPADLNWLIDSNIQSYESIGTPENTAQVHPYQFTTSMAELAQEQGAQIILGTVTSLNHKNQDQSQPIESITYTPKPSSPSSPSLPPITLPTTHTLLTLGPWTRTLLPHCPITSLRAHSITIRPSAGPPLPPHALFTSITLPSSSITTSITTPSLPSSPNLELYPRPNHTLYACSNDTDTDVPLPPTSALVDTDPRRCDALVEHCAAISDPLRHGVVIERQACYLPVLEEGRGVDGPLIGDTAVPGLYLGAGHSCWGIQNGPGTGRVLSWFVFGGCGDGDGDGDGWRRGVEGLDPRTVLLRERGREGVR